jgi:hypothetical protein
MIKLASSSLSLCVLIKVMSSSCLITFVTSGELFVTTEAYPTRLCSVISFVVSLLKGHGGIVGVEVAMLKLLVL